MRVCNKAIQIAPKRKCVYMRRANNLDLRPLLRPRSIGAPKYARGRNRAVVVPRVWRRTLRIMRRDPRCVRARIRWAVAISIIRPNEKWHYAIGMFLKSTRSRRDSTLGTTAALAGNLPEESYLGIPHPSDFRRADFRRNPICVAPFWRPNEKEGDECAPPNSCFGGGVVGGGDAL